MPEVVFRKNDRVQFRLGLSDVEGVVKEDRGPIGVQGRHLYRVRFYFGADAETASEVELPAVDLKLVQKGSK